MIGTAKATVLPDPVFALPMQSLPRTSEMMCTREKTVVLPAKSGGMHAACTSVGVRIDIAAKAETICFEMPRPVKVRIWLLKGAWSSFWVGGFGSFLFAAALGFRAFVEGKSVTRSTGGLGGRCKVVEENSEVGGSCSGVVFDRCALSTESTSLSEPMSLSHSSNRIRLVGLDDCVSFFDRRLSPIIIVLAFGLSIERSEFSRAVVNTVIRSHMLFT